MATEETEYDLAVIEAQKKKPDLEKVFSLLLLGHGRGDLRATHAMAKWYLNGKYVKKSLNKGVSLLKEASEGSHPDALYDLGVCYEMGSGVAKSPVQAFRYYTAAALSGDAQSFYEVGRCYFHGIGTKKDRKTAEIWFAKASELGVEE